MRILITNAVPLNGGDEALLIATILGIRTKVPDARFTVLCNDATNVKKYINYADIDWDWEYSLRDTDLSLKKKVFLKVRHLLNNLGITYCSSISTLLSSQNEKRIIQLYDNADYIVSSAGGYIHDIYDYEWRMQAYSLALRLNKKLIFFGQSIGPFVGKNKKQHRKLLKILASSEHIYLREHISKEHLKSIGYNCNNVTVSTDIAFTLYEHYQHLFKPEKKRDKKIVVSFREWNYESSKDVIIGQAAQIVTHLIDKGFEVSSVSTCQGLDCYTYDDSVIAMLIKEKLPIHARDRFIIDNHKYPVDKLISIYSEFNAYIGMRLHGAILAMLGGTPAFNLGYEDKTAGIYQDCGILEFQSNFKEDIHLILSRIDYFLESLASIKLKEIVEKASERALSNFDIFKH